MQFDIFIKNIVLQKGFKASFLTLLIVSKRQNSQIPQSGVYRYLCHLVLLKFGTQAIVIVLNEHIMQKRKLVT